MYEYTEDYGRRDQINNALVDKKVQVLSHITEAHEFPDCFWKNSFNFLKEDWYPIYELYWRSSSPQGIEVRLSIVKPNRYRLSPWIDLSWVRFEDSSGVGRPCTCPFSYGCTCGAFKFDMQAKGYVYNRWTKSWERP
jgi:hypothetical protein